MDWIPIAERLPEDHEEVEVATFHGGRMTFSSKTMQWIGITPIFGMVSIHRHPPSFTHWRPVQKERDE